MSTTNANTEFDSIGATGADERRVPPAFLDALKRRRTFGIISHPDAGKTTLTERLLLLGGAIRMAGDVRARKTARHAKSDWMEIEKQRGISVTSSVMRFTHGPYELNLLDTPGHEDFSEDTYRVLTAVDSALMVIDSVKGVENQTRKLMEVCRLRQTPILTFINKLDREGLDPLDLLSDIEDSLGISAAPLTWPVGRGKRFAGTFHLLRHELRLVDQEEAVQVANLDDPLLDEMLGSQADALRSDVELLQGAGTAFDLQAYREGRQTPVLFGSALDGFGVPELLDTFCEIAPPPLPRETTTRIVHPEEPQFSGVVFKIQANMDPAHRDRIAFLRICSGRFERGMRVMHQRTGKEVRLANATTFMAQDRTGVEEAYPGDIIGIHNHGTVHIGDTFTEKEPLQFTGLPDFAPEHFRRARMDNALRAKHLEKGLRQLTEEGAIQLYRPLWNNEYVLGAVGPLQFDVISTRLAGEYNVDVRLDSLTFHTARWVSCDDPQKLQQFVRAQRSNLAEDAHGGLVYLAENTFRLNRVQEEWPAIRFDATRDRTS